MDESIEEFRIIRRRDIDPVSDSQSFADGLGVRAQSDDQIWSWEQAAGQPVEAAAEIKLRAGEPSARMKEACESVKIQIEAAIHQGGFAAGAQLTFLFGAVDKIIELVGKCIFFILVEERLKWTFFMLFECGGKIELCA